MKSNINGLAHKIKIKIVKGHSKTLAGVEATEARLSSISQIEIYLFTSKIMSTSLIIGVISHQLYCISILYPVI